MGELEEGVGKACWCYLHQMEVDIEQESVKIPVSEALAVNAKTVHLYLHSNSVPIITIRCPSECQMLRVSNLKRVRRSLKRGGRPPAAVTRVAGPW